MKYSTQDSANYLLDEQAFGEPTVCGTEFETIADPVVWAYR